MAELEQGAAPAGTDGCMWGHHSPISAQTHPPPPPPQSSSCSPIDGGSRRHHLLLDLLQLEAVVLGGDTEVGDSGMGDTEGG